MPRSLIRFFSNVLFWTYPRGGWQYDILCGLILAFIFLTPKSVFGGSAFHEEYEPQTINVEERELPKEPTDSLQEPRF